MPIYQENYVAPVWVNGRAPTVGETELRAASKTLQASQVLTGSGAPTPQTAGGPGQLYADTSTSPWTLYRCYGVFGGVYRWWPYDDPGGSFALDYDAGSTYDAGAYCIHDTKLYRCISDIASPEAWTEAHWTQVKAAPEVQAHTGNRNNPHKVTAAQIGLGNLTNERQYSRVNPPLKLGTMALSGAWSGSGGVYSQPVTVTGAEVTHNSHVEAQFSPLQLAALLDAGVGNITIANNMGALTAAAFGGPPNSSMTAQCSVSETKVMLPYLEFAGEGAFTLGTATHSKFWNGTLEFSTDGENWQTWDGTTALSSGAEDCVFLRGTGNTRFGSVNTSNRLTISGANVACNGNVEMLLDYAQAYSGIHPTMGILCFANLFYSCKRLIKAPELSPTTLTDRCYLNMFRGCTSLTKAPKLPATTLAPSCYYAMFRGCTSLSAAPALPATTLAQECYDDMFMDCTSLSVAPLLPATMLADVCYGGMFYGCTSLTKAPELPATTLAHNCYASMFRECTSLKRTPELPAIAMADGCYVEMFRGCTSLTKAPELPATTLAPSCYSSMFYGCTSLSAAPALPASALAATCYSYMFCGCTSLTRTPELSATTLVTGCYESMFRDCVNMDKLPALMATNYERYSCDYMFKGCTSIKLSETQTGEYTAEYRIPASGQGTEETAGSSFNDMFTGTGGTFAGTPTINTTYYTSNAVV